ncbi:class II aldolase/adducin family protein [Pyrobaculum neutrophilum]|uniref:Class II aldolase/adducin family protein n=1 Tax=Pyrobaculum neutrophilum (strain DSM 2338 / JCM 9278 / NBRC 100436 / V24Sta) TaxID=444157 RepID=B1Y943_PYRNV|nr:class II aldolase/adducin family protein [Pyrobaculum neutrophilum]ACB40272.1 class II aldolase/adducin family protein [Pyrobaculum neutrophilum V24Sta]
MGVEEEFLRYVKLLYERGYLTLLSGNVSLRVGDKVLVTPTTRPKPFLTVDDLVWIDLEGRVVKGGLKPTSEWRMHVAIYRRRPDVNAVVHVHDILPTVLAERLNPSLLSEAELQLGTEIAVVPYIQPGTAELAEAVASALERRNAAVLKRHGVVTVGRDLAEAVNRAEVVSDVAKATLYSLIASKLWSA